ncbi:MAG: aldo/keto reductase [Devosia sp.]
MGQDVPQFTLRDGKVMPQLGFGAWQIANADCPAVIGEAIRVGYRAFDTAQAYNNEEGVGRTIRECGLPRTDFFITSKLRNNAHSRDLALRSFDESMKKLGFDQLDLFLIQWPVPNQDKYVEAWKVLVELQQQGHIRSIGVSNFDREHLERIIGESGVTPVINQIELHPLYQQRTLRGYHARRGIRIASWSPLGPGTTSAAWWWTHGRSTEGNLFGDPTITAIARKHGRNPAQIILRWHVQEGLLLNCKSANPVRIAENFALFDFELDAEDIYRIEAMDRPESGKIGAEPSEWNLLS